MGHAMHSDNFFRDEDAPNAEIVRPKLGEQIMYGKDPYPYINTHIQLEQSADT